MLRRGWLKRWQVFVLGALIGLIVFGFLYGFEIVNPTYTDWIWHSETHDTGQAASGCFAGERSVLWTMGAWLLCPNGWIGGATG